MTTLDYVHSSDVNRSLADPMSQLDIFAKGPVKYYEPIMEPAVMAIYVGLTPFICGED